MMFSFIIGKDSMDKGVVSTISLCNKVNILIFLSGFIINSETYLQNNTADKFFYVKLSWINFRLTIVRSFVS